MKTQSLLFFVTAATLFLFPAKSFAQPPDLGTTVNLVLYTTAGAVDNTGTSDIFGNIGTNNGAITGFGLPTTLMGNVDSGNAKTAQYSADLTAAYSQLFNTAPTSSSHTPAFGSGETLFAGVYSIVAAGSVAGELILDAQGNPNAVFIFKFGGAFTTGASTTITLSNGALACNVFWGAEGAISMAAATSMKGTLIANNGAISMGAGGRLEGRMLSTTGAASVYAVSASVPACSLLPIGLLSFTGICNMHTVVLKWSTATETNNNFFTVERSVEGINWQIAGTVPGAGNSFFPHTYTLTDRSPDRTGNFYRLKQTDLTGMYKYSNVVTVEKCENSAAGGLTIYPNPSTGKFRLLFNDNADRVSSIEIFNARGQQIIKQNNFQSDFDLSQKGPGIYFMRIHLNSEVLNRIIVVN